MKLGLFLDVTKLGTDLGITGLGLMGVAVMKELLAARFVVLVALVLLTIVRSHARIVNSVA